MKNMIIAHTGNSRWLKSIENFMDVFPTYEDFGAALASGTLPIDLAGINPSGLDQLGDPLNKATLLQDETASVLGFDDTAVPDDMFYAISMYAVHGNRVTVLQVTDENGEPMEGVTVTGTGNAAVTDARGAASVVITKDTAVTFTPPYLDVQTVTQTISPDTEHIVQTVSVTLPFIEIGEEWHVAWLTASGSVKVRRGHSAMVCCAGGGNNGNAGTAGNQYSAGKGGAGGSGGKIINEETLLTRDAAVDVVVGSANGGDSLFGELSSGGGNVSTIPLLDSEIAKQVGGNGASGGNGGTEGTSGTGANGGNSARAGGGGGGGNDCGKGGTSVGGSNGGKGNTGTGTVVRAGSGGAGGYAGGGGGGGGGAKTNFWNQNPGYGGAGGSGVVLVKFLD